MAENSNKVAIGTMMLLAGGALGAALAILYAPQSGAKTRRKLTRYARQARNEAEEMARDAAEAITDLVDDLSDRTTGLLGRGEEVAEDWRNTLLDAIDRGQEGLDRQRKKLARWWH